MNRESAERFLTSCRDIREQLAKTDLARKMTRWADFANGLDAVADIIERACEQDVSSVKSRKCQDCGTVESAYQREYDKDCTCGGKFVIYYETELRPSATIIEEKVK